MSVIGHKFNKLTVLYTSSFRSVSGAIKYKCKCGNEVIVRSDSLKSALK